MYLIQYSEAAERLGWNVKDCTDDNNSVIISRNGVSGRVYDFKLNKENFITDMERLASQFDADAYAMEYHSTHKNWSERNILGEIVADCYKIRDMLRTSRISFCATLQTTMHLKQKRYRTWPFDWLMHRLVTR